MLKIRRLNNQALSPIFATLIILAIVTIMFIPVFIWASSFTASSNDSAQSSSVIATERIVIEVVNLRPWASPTVQSCTIYVRNIGETAVTINNVLISGSNIAVHPYQKQAASYPSPPTDPMQMKTLQPGTATPLTTITKGNLIEISIPNLACVDQAFRISNGTAYTIQVFTTRGVGDTYTIVAT